MVNPVQAGKVLLQQGARVLEEGAARVPGAVARGAQTLPEVVDEAVRITGQGAARLPGGVAGAFEAGVANPLTWRNTTWEASDVVRTMGEHLPASVRNVPATEAGLRSLFDEAGWDTAVRFFNGNPSAAAADKFMENLAFTTRAAGARFSVAQVEAAAGAGSAATLYGQVSRNLASIRGVGQSQEIGELTRALDRTGLTPEFAQHAQKLQQTIGRLAETYPDMARELAREAATQLSGGNVTQGMAAAQRLAARAERLLEQTANRTATLNPGTGADAQRALARNFLRAADDASAARVLAPPVAAAAAPAAAEGGIPASLRSALGHPERLESLNDAQRAALANNGGHQRLEALARTNRALADTAVSEIRRSGDAEGTLRIAEFLARPGNLARAPEMATGGWTRSVLPEMLRAEVRAGTPPAQAGRVFEGLIQRGMPDATQRTIYEDLRRLSTTMPPAERTPYLSAVDSWWARARIRPD